ncbi:LADA_0D12530g1_1 [Lachancea dasiensis]|uniref:non-specific serine/threonine protein kinase n=1 Tax=Lachancea dasiensis TaxID=1072105 RepID=A0A1G4J876_9SACH|nr:LADA_0D12530g1_1 [Lachancea dasiensis]
MATRCLQFKPKVTRSMATRVNLTPAQKLASSSGNTHHYALKQVIGKGAYGIVYRAMNRQTGKQVAIKVIEYEEEEELNEHMLEIDLLKNLKHENIVKYHGFIQKSHQLFILLAYCSQGSLRDLIKRGPVEEMECKTYIKQTLCGLQYLHEQGVIHRDIKAANLLLDGHNVVKLADFGVSTRVNSMAMTYAGSPNWMAPEVMMGQGASTVSDIWSLGATVVEILTGNPPFHNLLNEAACYAIVHDEYLPPKYLSSRCRKFIRTCFQKNVFQRATAQELLTHEWISETQKPALEKFKEEEEGEDWRHEFLEVDVSPFKGHDTKSGHHSLLQLRQNSEICNPYLIYGECDMYSIASCLVDLCRHGQLQHIGDMFAYDAQSRAGECKELFIRIGGISALLCHIGPSESLISQYFLDHTSDLIKCGILQYCDSITDYKLLISLAIGYGKILDHKDWCNWCSKLVNIEDAILRGLAADNKLAHEMLISLSGADSFEIGKELIRALMSLPLRSNSRLRYTVFKSLNIFLERKSIANSDMGYAEGEFHSTPQLSSRPSSIQLANVPVYVERTFFPNGFVDWLLKFTPESIDDPRLVKNFVELCFNVGHLDRVVLGEIVEHGGFLRLSQQLIQQLGRDWRSKYTRSILSIALNLCTELSQELIASYLPIAIDISLRFLRISDFVTGGTEVLLHCFLFAMRENYNITENSESILIHCNTSVIQVPRAALLHTFYSEEPKFGNYITKFAKLCALPPCKSLACDIVSHPQFMKKTQSLFDVYRGSLIIQIDFLKFLKLILTRYVEFTPLQPTNKNIPTEALITSAIKQPVTFPTGTEVLRAVVDFLLSNWSPNNLRPNQVGSDSVLIKQLCHDIELLVTTKPRSLSKRSNGHSFVIPTLQSI